VLPKKVSLDFDVLQLLVPKGFFGVTKEVHVSPRTCVSFREVIFGKYVCNGVSECTQGYDEAACPDRFACDAGIAQSLITGKLWFCVK